MFREEGQIVGCAINEGTGEGDAFFLFSSKKYAENVPLIEEMINFAQTMMSDVEENRITRYVNLRIPEWNTTLVETAVKHGFQKQQWTESVNIKAFGNEALDAVLPEGYRYADGEGTLSVLYGDDWRRSALLYEKWI